MKNKTKLLLLKKNFMLLINNQLIYNQFIFNMKNNNNKFTKSALFYWVMYIYMKRLGLLKK